VAPTAHHLKRARVSLLTVFGMVYIFVSAGPFGIEDMISSSGPGLALLLLVLLPVLWSLPMALVASELGSAIPGEGGFYLWVRRAMGDFWGFQVAWWWVLSIFVDSTLYVVLVASYLQSWLGFDTFTYYLICWAIIAIFAAMNIIGIKAVALSSTLMAILVLAPFVVFTILGLSQWQHDPFTPFTVPEMPFFGTGGTLITGLALGIWMYSGYDSISTLSGEIHNSQRLIPRALMLVLPFVTLTYVLVAVAALAAYGNWELFAVEGSGDRVTFVEIARVLGGPMLGLAVLGAALFGNLALFLDSLATGARPLFALAEDGLFPRSISRVSGRFGTPVAAIVLMAAINAVLVLGPFSNLVVIDVMLFASAYVLMFVAAVRLRIREPGLKRRFRIPLGTAGMVAMVTPPILIAIVLLYVTLIDRSVAVFGFSGFNLAGLDVGWYGIGGVLAMLSGPVLYSVFRRACGGPSTPSQTAGDEWIAVAEEEV